MPHSSVFGREIHLVTTRSLRNPYFIASVNATRQTVYARSISQTSGVNELRPLLSPSLAKLKGAQRDGNKLPFLVSRQSFEDHSICKNLVQFISKGISEHFSSFAGRESTPD